MAWFKSLMHGLRARYYKYLMSRDAKREKSRKPVQVIKSNKFKRVSEVLPELSSRNARFNRSLSASDKSVEIAAANAPVGGRVPMREQGITGLDTRNGRVYQEYNSDLKSLSTRMLRYEEMRRSDSALAVIEALISLPVRAARWYIEPGDDKRVAEELEQNLFYNMSHSFDEFLRQILLAPLYGFTIHEKVFEYQESGWLGWRKFAERSRRTVDEWHFDETGGLSGIKQVGFRPDDGSYFDKDIDIKKLLVWTWRGEEGNPEGVGAFRQAWKHYFYKTAFEEFAGMRIERQALGTWVAEPPDTGTTIEESLKVAESLERLRAGESSSIICPEGWKIRNEQQGPADVPFEAHIERQHQYMLQSILGQFVGLGQSGDKGSFAQAEDASSMFMVAERAVAGWICDTFNRYAIPQVVRYNVNKTQKMPRLRHGPIGVRDLDKLGNLLRSLWDVNVDIPAEFYPFVLEEAGFPKMDESVIAQHVASKDKMRVNGNGYGSEEKPGDKKQEAEKSDELDN